MSEKNSNKSKLDQENIAEESEKSKADLRRERKAVQEAQRAKKAAEKQSGSVSSTAALATKNSNETKKASVQSKSEIKIDQKEEASQIKNSTLENAPTEISNKNVTQNQEKDAENSEKSKADLRRERKAIQEAQRAKKASGTVTQAQATKSKSEQNLDNKQTVKEQEQSSQNQNTSKSNASTISSQKILETGLTTNSPSTGVEKEKNKINIVKLFHHFDQYKRDYSIVEKYSIDSPSVHPAFIKLGVEYANDRINGSNARCLAFLDAMKKFVDDYKAPSKENKKISKDLESKLKTNINFLAQCRPLSISMGNAIKELKQVILHLPIEITDTEAKKIILEEIDKFIYEKILLAWETISKYMLANSDTVISGRSYVKSKITNEDCILVYAHSSLVTHVLIQASKKFPNIRVIVVDSRPKLKGKLVLEQLVKHGINCTYVLINGISFLMHKVTKVILGANALLANGYVLNEIGSSQIALVAKAFNVPVVVCCETYKFCDKVQTDALVYNELENPLDLVSYSNKNLNHVSPLAEWNNENKDFENINILNLSYDVTSPDFISCVVTDMGMLPCSSVAVVLRLKNRDNFQITKKNSISINLEFQI